MSLRFSWNRSNSPARRRAAAAVFSLFFAPTSARAQSAPLRPAAPPQPVLRGPEVTDRDVPGVAGTFGNSDQKRKFAERIPPRVFRDALQILDDDDAPADIRATPEQRDKVEAMIREFEGEVRSYMREHREDLSRLRRAASEVRDGRPGGPPPRGDDPERRKRRPEAAPDRDMPPPHGMDQMDAPPPGNGESPDREAARQQLRDLMEGAPQPEKLMTRIWAELTEPQHAAVERELDKFRAEQAKDREEAYVRERVNRPDGARPGQPGAPLADNNQTRPGADKRPPGPAAGSGRRGALTPERRDRLLRAFEQMSPERQEQMLERIERLLAEGGPADGRKRREGPGQGQPKPPPGLDQVDVPSSPDEGPPRKAPR